MASSENLLQETVVQLLSHHQSVEGTLSEITSLRQLNGNQRVFSPISDIGCIPLLLGYSETGNGGCITDVYINKFLSVINGDQKSQNLKAEQDSLYTVLKELKHTDKLFDSRLKKALVNCPSVPLNVIWMLHQEGIFSLVNYFTMQQERSDFFETLLSDMNKTRLEGNVDLVSGILSELLYMGFSEGNGGSTQKTAGQILDQYILNYIDGLITGSNDETGMISLSSVQLDLDALRRACSHLLIAILSHRPEMKVSQAIREQERWAYGKISPPLIHLFKQLLLPFEVDEVLQQLRQILEQQEVNWQLLLSFVSVVTVCLPESAKLFLEFIDGLLEEGLGGSDIESTIMGMLLARQACFQGPHVFLTYSDWFQRTFSEGSRSLANNRKSFTALMKFLTDLVPYESAQHIKVHITHQPFIPTKCRQILSDYITLAKTRLEDLKEGLDIPNVESGTSTSHDKAKQLSSDVESAVKLFESSGKVPTSIIEASIFKKPYYIGQFLPVLLQPRPLPDVPDSKMKLIATLKRSDKIPASMYTSYEKACKREASQLLEGVFVDLDSDDDMELSPFEQFENTLVQLKNTVKNNETGKTSKHSVPEVLSLLCGRMETVMSMTPHTRQQPEAVITMDTENIIIEPLHLKVIDALLNITSELVQMSFSSSSPCFTWLQKLIQSLSQYHGIIESLYKRMFTLVIKQGISLQKCHVECIAALLGELQFLSDKLPRLNNTKPMCSDHIEKLTLTESIFGMLPVSRSAWTVFTLRLVAAYLKHVLCVYTDQQSLVFPSLIKKFFYLSTRQNVSLRYHSDTSSRMLDDDIVSAMFTSDIVQNFFDVYPLTMAEWVNFELSVSPDDDILTDHERYEYFSWIVYQNFLARSQVDCYSMASTVVSEVLNNDLRHFDTVLGCSRCLHQSVDVSCQSNSRHYLISLLQELTRMFSCGSKETDLLPWLQQQLIDQVSIATSEIRKHSNVQQYMRLCLSLPAYLLFSDTPYGIQGQTTMTATGNFLNDILVPHLCEGLYLPAGVTVFICQGLMQVNTTDNLDEILNSFYHISPVFMMSLLVHSKVVGSLLLAALKLDCPLKNAFQFIRGGMYEKIDNIDHWQQAAILLSTAVNSVDTNRHLWSSFIKTSSDVQFQLKVCCTLVQMILLQLTHILNFLDVKECGRLKLLLTDIIQWVDGKYLAQVLLTDELEESTKLCVNDRLIKLKNLTIMRYLVENLDKVTQDKMQSVEFVSSILRTYSDMMALLDGQDEQIQIIVDDEVQSIQHCIMKLTESINLSILKQVDQDLLLSCGPLVTDCVIRKLSS